MKVGKIFKQAKEDFSRNKKTLLLCIGLAFLWGFLTHGYMYWTNAVSHDSLNEFIANDRVIDIKLNAGRIFVPVYEFLVRGFITVPPLIGLLSMFFIGLGVFVIVKIFDIRSTLLIVFAAGILTANVSMISLNGTFIHDADYDMLGLLLSILSVYVWKQCRDGKVKYLLGSIPLLFAIGFYQTYISVTITLILFVLILEALRGEKCKKLFVYGLKGIAMLLCAAVAYFVCLKVALAVTGITQKGSYNFTENLATLFPTQIFIVLAKAYLRSVYRAVMPITVFSTATNVALNGAFLAVVAFLFFRQVCRKETLKQNKLLAIGLLLLVPLGMNVCEVLANRGAHSLMYYAVCFAYLFGLLMEQEVFGKAKKEEVESVPVHTKPRKVAFAWIQPLCYLLVGVVLFGNVRLANTFYSLKEHQKDATLSLMTRVVSRIEDCPDYVAGTTEVVFVGEIDEQLVQDEAYKKWEEFYIYYSSVGIGSAYYYQNYFKHIMKISVAVLPPKEWEEWRNNDAVKAMPSYPEAGGIQMINGTVVVKWSDYE